FRSGGQYQCATTAAVLQLSRCLGLREEEAVQSVKSLKSWKQAIQNNQERVNVVFGTEGGRLRETTVIDREKTLNAINFAIKVAGENNGKLIDKHNLHQAIGLFRRVAMAAGLTGKNSPHSLRYAYAEDAAKFHGNTMSHKETLAMVSMDLGHADGRGRYISQVYYKNEQSE
ncbi:integrase domain-containing protein, partial [Candidatus Erwinia dacicola]